MNAFQFRFLTLTAVAIALVTPSQVTFAKGPQSTTEFTIEVNQDGGNIYDQGGHWYDAGRFQASGAVQDNGRAVTFYDAELGMSVMELYGKSGDMEIALWSDANADTFFTIIAATGGHAGLVGITGTVSGYAEVKRNGDIKLYQTLTGSIAP